MWGSWQNSNSNSSLRWAWHSAILTSSQMTAVLLAPVPHFSVTKFSVFLKLCCTLESPVEFSKFLMPKLCPIQIRCELQGGGRQESVFFKAPQLLPVCSQCWELLSLMSSLWCWLRFIITYLADYIPPGHKELDTTEHTHTHTHTHAHSWEAKLFKKKLTWCFITH